MWKRIQTYLIIAAALLLLAMFEMDMCHATDPETSEQVSIKFTERSQFLIFTFVCSVLCLVTLCYRKSLFSQMYLCLLNALMLLGYQIWILVAFLRLRSVYTLSIASLFPAISIVLLLVSIRFIAAEEVQSRFLADLSGAEKKNGHTGKQQQK